MKGLLSPGDPLNSVDEIVIRDQFTGKTRSKRVIEIRAYIRGNEYNTVITISNDATPKEVIETIGKGLYQIAILLNPNL